MKALLIGDIHYRSDGISLIPERKTKYGIEFLRRIKRRINQNIDVIIICGDILDDGENPESEKQYNEIKKVHDDFPVKKVLFTFGNHDKNIEKFYKIFGKESKTFIFENFIFYVFWDNYLENDVCIREEKEIENFKEFVLKNKGKKVVVIQHNPIYPKIESSYPYNISQPEKIHNLYKENNVFLSISGHYHKGIELKKIDGIYYLTLPAICEEPFKYFIIEISEPPKIKEEYLKNNVELIDYHCHTEFGYCAEDVSMEKVIERCELFGVKKIYFTEHAGQLYLSRDDYWKYKFFGDIEIIKKQRKEKKDRIKEYVEKFKSLNTEKAGLGIEAEINKDGKLTLLEEDKQFFEIITGAVHYLPPEYFVNQKLLEKKFLWTLEKLILNKINILAHPFRFFVRNNLERPKHLYRHVARMLREGNVKAELNFHTNNPDPEFFRICLEENVDIVFGSDSHNLLEVGDFSKHIEFMRNLNQY
ncbi:MAG: metallophosphoesterase [Candidatus Omnitrophica bacterium]|nr:metallophosphoesterase [Candidatus Omnitrophota bacterium]